MEHTGINKKDKTSDTLKSLNESQKHYAKCGGGGRETQRIIYCMISFKRQSRRGKSIRIEKRSAISRTWEWREGINFKGP